MGDTHYPYPVALQWKEDPENLKTLKSKLLLYFQERSESHGGECEIRDTDCSRGSILIHFKEERDRDGVLQKDSHKLKLSRRKKISLDVRSVGADSEWSPPVGSQSIHAEKKNSRDKGLNFIPGPALEEAGVENDPFGKSRFQVTLPNGLTLSVYKGDLCRHNVDVIVNAANEKLKHGGGLAKAILDAAGHKLQDDCDQIIRKYGKLPTGESVITDAGNLPCKQIIHTVGPRWKSHPPSRCERLLRRAITTSLQLASEKNHSSIAIPAVSSGVFGFPIKLCAENIVEAIRDYVETPGQQSTLQRIHLVDMKEETVKAFSEAAKAKFGNQMSAVPSTAVAPQPVTRATRKPPAPVNRGNDNTVRTEEGLKTRLIQKNIEDNSVSTSQLAINTDAATSGATNRQSAGTGSNGKSHKLPSHWKPMDKTLVMEVDVAPGTPEYSSVEKKFQRTCRNQILKILRVQNRDLWLNYQIKKQNIDSKNGSTTNERELFHGTNFNSIQHVNQYGFHRSYAGRNAAAIGNGTYFAANANKVADDTFSKPDGERHMYLARVLTGLYCVGRQGMITPPAKNATNPTDLYDSVTDNVQSPSMFVIFNDIQAYPEYHIIFQ